MYEGVERRNVNRDHDILIEIKTDVKHIVEWSKTHDKNDNDRFLKLDKDNAWRDKIIYGGLGIVGFITLVSHFIK